MINPYELRARSRLRRADGEEGVLESVWMSGAFRVEYVRHNCTVVQPYAYEQRALFELIEEA